MSEPAIVLVFVLVRVLAQYLKAFALTYSMRLWPHLHQLQKFEPGPEFELEYWQPQADYRHVQSTQRCH